MEERDLYDPREDQRRPEDLVSDGPPWELKFEIGFFTAFVETIKALILRPGDLFRGMNRERGIADALVFTLAIQVFTTAWSYALSSVLGEPVPIVPPQLKELVDPSINIDRIAVFLFPVSLVLFHFLKAFALRTALGFRGLENYSYSFVFRFLCYASGGAAVLMLLPFFGGLASFLFSFYLAYVALRELYGLNLLGFIGAALLATLIGAGIMLGLVLLLAIVELLAFGSGI